MFETRKKHLIGLALLLGAGAGGLVYSGETAMNKDAYRAAQQRIEAQAQAQRKACDRYRGQAKEVCQAQAKGWEKVARAKLEARYEPGPQAEKEAKFARAEADYALAKQRCGLLKERARDTCRERAKHDREAAIRLAKVEKVQEVNARKREQQALREALRRPAPAAPRS